MTLNNDTIPATHRTARWKLFLLSMASVAIVLVVVELVLQGVGFPYDPDTLLKQHFVPAEKGWLVTRPVYTRIQTAAYPQRISEQKDAGVFRIALLGGSSVNMLGDAPALEQLLEAKTGKDVQILNFGICGCGSDRALISVRQALQLDVDAVLLYSGHNEFISESNRDTYRLRGGLLRYSKILQLCFGNAWVPVPGRLFRESEKAEIYAQFDKNLRDIAALCRDAGVLLIWGTVPSNLRTPPIIYAKGRHEKEALPPEPMLDYLRGAELFSAGQYPEAKQVLLQAIHGSPRPWRATWRNNEILRGVASELSVPLADVEQAVTDAAQHGIPGNDLFTDHCHLNERGYIILTEVFAETLVRELQRTRAMQGETGEE